MHCLGKEYRVVCSQTPDKHTFIDIVPADNALHQLILKERAQRSDAAKIIAGSIKLYDMGEGNRPEIIFLPPENGGLPEVELSTAEENLLRRKITLRFEEMMAQNQQSTIAVRPEIHQEYVNGIVAEMKNALDASLHAAAAPQSLAQEQNKILSERRNRADRTRAQTADYLRRRDEKYTKYNLTSLQIKQLLHRDYWKNNNGNKKIQSRVLSA